MKCLLTCSFLFYSEQETYCSKNRISDSKTAGDIETEINLTFLTLKIGLKKKGRQGGKLAPKGNWDGDIENLLPALAGWLGLLELWHINQKIVDSIPGHHPCLGLRVQSLVMHAEEATDRHFSIPSPLSKINKHVLW